MAFTIRKGTYGSGTTSMTVAVPTTPVVASGDALYIVMESNDSTSLPGTPTTPAGWTKLFEESQGTLSVTTLTIFGKIAGASESDVTVSGVLNHLVGSMIAVSNHGLTLITDTVVGTGAGSATASAAASSITVQGGSLVICCVGTTRNANNTANFSAWAATDPATLTELEDRCVTTQNGGGLGYAWGICAGTTTGTGTATLGTAENHREVFLGLAPENEVISAAVLETTPTFPAATRFDTDVTALALLTTPSLPAAELISAGGTYRGLLALYGASAQLPGELFAQDLAIIPSLPAAELIFDVTHAVLEVTPTLPAAGFLEGGTPWSASDVTWSDPSLSWIGMTPSGALYTQAVVFTTTPTLPAATIAAGPGPGSPVYPSSLVVEPVLPAASVSGTAGGSLYRLLLALTEFAGQQLSTEITAIVFTVTPLLPAATLEWPGTSLVGHMILTTTPSFPAATLEGYVGAMEFTTTPSLPTATLSIDPPPGLNIGHLVFVTSPSFPAATLEGLVGAMVFETAPVLPVATLDDAPRPGAQVGHVVLATTPSVPTATLDLGSGIPYLIGAMTLDTTSTLPAATFSTSAVGLIGAAELVTTPVLPPVTFALGSELDRLIGHHALETVPSFPGPELRFTRGRRRRRVPCTRVKCRILHEHFHWE